jgi:hypothetical protein
LHSNLCSYNHANQQIKRNECNIPLNYPLDPFTMCCNKLNIINITIMLLEFGGWKHSAFLRDPHSIFRNYRIKNSKSLPSNIPRLGKYSLKQSSCHSMSKYSVPRGIHPCHWSNNRWVWRIGGLRNDGTCSKDWENTKGQIRVTIRHYFFTYIKSNF